MEKLGFAVIGYGRIGKRHARIIHDHPETELLAVVDNNPKKLEEFKEMNWDIPSFSGIDELLAHQPKGVEVVNICTPNNLHAPMGKQVLESGYNAVIEKPMGLNVRECENLLHKALKNNKKVFVVKQNRYSPPSKWLKEIVKDGRLGDIYTVQINCYWNRDDRYYLQNNDWKGQLAKDGGALFTQFSHFIDIMYWIFGDVENINARFQNYNHKHSTEFEDTGIVQFDFIKGGTGCLNFSTSCWNKNMESSITVVGSKGSVKVGGQYMDQIEYCHVENYEKPELPPTNPPNDYGPFKGSAANHHYVIQNVVDTLLHKSSIDVNALEGLKVVDIIQRIYATRNIEELNKMKQENAYTS